MIFSSLAALMSVISFGGSFDYTTSDTFNMWIEHNRSIHIEIDDFFTTNNANLLLYYNDDTEYQTQKTYFAKIEVGSDYDGNDLFWYYDTWCNSQLESNIYISVDYDCYDGGGSESVYYSPFVYANRFLDSQSTNNTYTDNENMTWVRGDSIYCSIKIDVYLIPQGIFDAISSSYSTGYEEGYHNGYDYGYRTGAEEGYPDAYNSGYQTGLLEGQHSSEAYQNGYRAGYQNGLSQSTQDFGFMNLFTGIADTPIMMMRSLFGFELFGTQVLSVVLTLFTALVVLHLLRRIIK